MNVALRNRVFADVLNKSQGEIIPDLGRTLSPRTSVLLKEERGKFETQTQGRWLLKTEGEIRMRQPHAKKYPRLPTAIRSQRYGIDFLRRGSAFLEKKIKAT